jgi:hypothetical protein
MQLFDAYENELAYTTTSPYLTGVPASMSMLVEFKDASQGLEMELYMDGYPVVTNADFFMLPFEAVGTVTVALENLEIRINSAQTGISKQGPTAEYVIEGMSLEASLYQNSQTFKVDGKDVTLTNCTFGTEGLKTGTVLAGGSDIGRFERDDTGLKLILKDESGNDEAPIYIQ